MLTPDQLEALPRRFVQLWQQVEDDILQDIARRMKSLGELDPLTPTAIWQAWRLAETRAVRSNTVATLAKYTGKAGRRSSGCWKPPGHRPWLRTMPLYGCRAGPAAGQPVPCPAEPAELPGTARPAAPGRT